MIPFDWRMLGNMLRSTFSAEHFTVRHALISVTFLLLTILFMIVILPFRILDSLFFPSWRKTPVQAPIYILATPRSGTTFLHRMLCADDQFSWIKLYHTIFPSVILYKLFAGLGWLDSKIGSPFQRLIGMLEGRAFKGWEGIHATGLSKSEEDEQYWVYTLMTPASLLLFPWLNKTADVRFVDHLEEPRRRKLGQYYLNNLQRHAYATGQQHTLLAKNALAIGRLRTQMEVTPDMRVVHLVRHPYEAIASMISMFTVPWKAHSPEKMSDPEYTGQIATLLIEYYRYMLELQKELPADRYIEVRYENLIAEPKAVVERIYDQFELPMSDDYAQWLDAEVNKSRQYKSSHSYSLADFGLDEADIAREAADLFEHYGFAR
ncbi:MAG: sulfotransferase [Gammaproteobacteria bacterium]|nr:sulfotransferase [Gammaproteobacteria bacterium]